MAHYAKVIDGKVVNVIVAEKEFFDTFVDDTPGIWIQTSYNTRGGKHYDAKTKKLSSDQSKALRGNYAGIGFTYDEVNDLFVPPQPFSSWVLDSTKCTWKAPKDYPSDNKHYIWDESKKDWVVI
jgi:hypothetical protein|tara:strand:+ start:1224 stop:1595 length:372 start_codon:yes stop_codon:yes gene_type:complete